MFAHQSALSGEVRVNLDRATLNWLLEENVPGVRVRALIGLCCLSREDAPVQVACRTVLQSLPAALDLAWMENKGLPLLYALIALAECGLTREWLPIEPAVNKALQGQFDAGCGDLLGLRALVMLGYGLDERVQQRLAQVSVSQLPDGG